MSDVDSDDYDEVGDGAAPATSSVAAQQAAPSSFAQKLRARSMEIEKVMPEQSSDDRSTVTGTKTETVRKENGEEEVLVWLNESFNARSENPYEIASQFSDEQLARYSAFRRSTFYAQNGKKLRRIMDSGSKSRAAKTMVIVMAGCAKVFVGEVVRLARKIQKRAGRTGALLPDDVREAYRVLRARGAVPSSLPLRDPIFRN